MCEDFCVFVLAHCVTQLAAISGAGILIPIGISMRLTSSSGEINIESAWDYIVF